MTAQVKRAATWLHRLGLGLVVLTIAACAHVAGPDAGGRAVSADTWQVAGRFAAGQMPVAGGIENEPVVGRFAWQHSSSEDVLWLIGPLGNALARIDITASGVRWQDATGKRGEATNLRALGESLAGVTLPELPAERWLHARWPANEVQERDAAARPLAAAGRGWQFAYRYGVPAPEDWPLAVEAAGPDGLWLRLALTEWNGVSDPAEQSTP